MFPALLSLLPPPLDSRVTSDRIPFTDAFARFTERFGGTVLVGSGVIAALCVVGLNRLTVENSFIDYFKSSTEIHQGMITIDDRLGGTTPLDVVITDEPPPENYSDDPSPAIAIRLWKTATKKTTGTPGIPTRKCASLVTCTTT